MIYCIQKISQKSIDKCQNKKYLPTISPLQQTKNNQNPSFDSSQFKHEILITNYQVYNKIRYISFESKQANPMQRSFIEQDEESEPIRTSHILTAKKVKQQQLILYLTEEIGLNLRCATILVKVHQCATKAEVIIPTYDRYCSYQPATTKSPVTSSFQAMNKPSDVRSVTPMNPITPSSIWGSSNRYNKSTSLLKFRDSDLSVSTFSEQILFVQNEPNNESHEVARELCQICYMNYNPNEMAVFYGQKHSLCITCLGSFVDQKITSMQIDTILCPHCNVKLTPQVIKQFAHEKTYAVYEQFVKNAEIQKNPNLMWCPNPKCSVVISIQKKKKNFPCPKCAFKICGKCKNEAHPGKSCNSVFQNEIKSWQNNNSIQRCKKCSSIVQKISGCNHMSCSVCGHEWCWLCGANYSQRHFNPLNPFGCAGMQNRDGVGAFRIWAWRVVLFLLIIISVPVAFPFALVFSGPFVSIQFFYKKVQYDNSRVKKFLAVVVGFVLGIMFDPLIWIGLVVVFAPRFFRSVRDYFRNRRRRIEISENRLNERLINDAIQNSENIVFQNGN